MNKSELIEYVAKTTGVSKTQAEEVINAVGTGIVKGIKSDKEFTWTGVFSAKVVKRAARTGINPQTKAPLKIPAKNVVKIKAGSVLQDAA